MREKEVRLAILYFLKKAQEDKIRVGRTRLMKLLYLLDVEYYRLYGKTYTGLEWIFYKYGPFTFELEDLLDKMGIAEEEVLLEKERILKQLTYDFEILDEDVKLPVESRIIADSLFDEWGGVDLNRLLDHVYFDTEPMEEVQLRRKLDFSKISSYKKEQKVAIPPDIKKKLRKIGHKIKQHLDKIENPPKIHLVPSQDIKITSIWDKEEAATLESLEGVARFEKEDKE